MIARLLQPRLSVRGLMVLIAVCGVLIASGLWTWREYFSPRHRWLRTIRDENAGIGRWEVAGRALTGRDPAVSPEMATAALIGALKDSHWNVRADAANSLSRGGRAADRAIPALIDALNDHEVSVRGSTARTLGWIIADGGRGRDRVIPALIASLRDVNPGIRATAAMSLGQIVKPADPGSGFVADALEQCLEDPKRSVRIHACWPLCRLGRGATCVPVLMEGLRDPDVSIRAMTVQLLAEAGPTARRAIPKLEALVRDEPNKIILNEALKTLTYLRSDPANDDH